MATTGPALLEPGPNLRRKMRTTLKCPANVALLLRIHVMGETENPNAPTTSAGLKLLQDCGAIKPFGYTFTTTELGQAWVKALCQVPVPRPVYVDESGKVIELP